MFLPSKCLFRPPCNQRRFVCQRTDHFCDSQPLGILRVSKLVAQLVAEHWMVQSRLHTPNLRFNIYQFISAQFSRGGCSIRTRCKCPSSVEGNVLLGKANRLDIRCECYRALQFDDGDVIYLVCEQETFVNLNAVNLKILFCAAERRQVMFT
jgi:hypothetical protein